MQLMTDNITREKRLTICNACPHKKGFLCGKCLCLISAKVSFKDGVCPIRNW